MNITPEQAEKHNRLYNEAWKLIKGEIHLDNRELSQPGWFASRRLRKAKDLFEATLLINPMGWNAMFAIAKIEQRFGNKQKALDWLLKAREFEPENTSLAKEASLTASQLGMQSLAIQIIDEAIFRNPKDGALRVNSGLAYILSGNAQTALSRFQEAIEIEPEWPMNRKLKEYATHVQSGKLPLPTSEADILRDIKAV